MDGQLPNNCGTTIIGATGVDGSLFFNPPVTAGAGDVLSVENFKNGADVMLNGQIVSKLDSNKAVIPKSVLSALWDKANVQEFGIFAEPNAE